MSWNFHVFTHAMWYACVCVSVTCFGYHSDEEQYPLRYYSPVLESESLPCPHPLKYNHTCTERPVALTTQPEYSNICTDWSVSPRREPEYTNICMDAPSSTYLHNCHTCVKQPIKQDLSGNSPRQQSRGQLQRTISNLEQQNKYRIFLTVLSCFSICAGYYRFKG